MAGISENKEAAIAEVTKILKSLSIWWLEQRQQQTIGQVTFNRLSVVALTQHAAILGVDVGMTEDQFVDVCRATFQSAYKKAAKFG